LNWDEGVPANEAGIDGTAPGELYVESEKRTPMELGEVAARWFESHLVAWSSGT
jgi:hypothetical protein